MQPWRVAARPATLWAAITPVVVGSALAEAQDVFRPGAMAAALVVSLAMQIGVNIANDVADAAKGADSASRIGPPRAVASGLLTPSQAWFGALTAFGVAGLAAIYLVVIAGWPVVVLGVSAVVAAVSYTSGPAYGYRGLGEVFVFIFFGLVGTVGTRFLHDKTAPSEAWILGVVVGLLITAILVANNLRDIETDEEAGKRTLAVTMGRRATRWLYTACVLGAFAVVAMATVLGALPGGTALGLIVTPAALPLIRIAYTEVAGPPLIRLLAGTSHLQAAFGFVAAVGLISIG